MLMFQIVAYDNDGKELSDGIKCFCSDSAAKSAAGRLAKVNDGPVEPKEILKWDKKRSALVARIGNSGGAK
jgi:hypothetical protein